MPKDLSLLMTEQCNEDTKHIDEMDTLDIIKTINIEDRKVSIAVKKQLPQIAIACEAIYEKLVNGGRLIYIGAGTSGRLGILDASECPPTYGVDYEMIQGLIAGGTSALFKAKEGAEDTEELAVEDLKGISLTDKDVVCGLAASGRTPYVVGGLMYANQVKATTISICCVESGIISKHANYPIELLVGPEVITGSTRMKAGTAQKMVLNMLSTTVMVKLGKVYGNLMVDLQPTNKKLEERAIKIIMQATNVSNTRAKELLVSSGRNVKYAILMAITNMSLEECKALLVNNQSNVAKAIRHSRRLS